MLPTAMYDPVLSVMQQIAQWNNLEQSWRILHPMLSAVSADLKGIPLLEASEQLRWALSDIGMKSNTVGISTNFPGTMRVEGIEHIGEVGDGKCRHFSAHQAIASRTRKPVISYGFFLLCKHMRDKQPVMIKDINGNDQRGTIISIERKDNNNSDWIVRMEKPNAPGQFYGFTVRTV